MKNILLLLLTLALLSAGAAQAQNQLVLYNMYRTSPQSIYLNPAFVPQYKVNIGLPGISSVNINASTGQLAFRDVFRREGDSLVIINSEDDEVLVRARALFISH